MDNPFIPRRVRSQRRTPVERYFAFVDSKRISDRLFLYVFLIAFVVSSTIIILRANEQATMEVPAAGGTLREGIVGSPRFVNPALAITRADQDMAELIFDGLMKVSVDGTLVPSIAESITISSDATVYNVVMRQDVVFHDGTPLTADDVIFTIDLIKSPELKSPLQGNFDDVTIERLGDYEVNFVLKEPYAPFIENLTVGILPRHEWKDLSLDQIPFSQHNTEPTGSGPYKIKSVKRNDSGLIDGYVLEAFSGYSITPKISELLISFYSNEQDLSEAFKTEKIDSATGLAQYVDDITSVRSDIVRHESALPRTFALFLNQNKSVVLRQNEVREVLNATIDREELVQSALGGHGRPLYGPVPPDFAIETESTQNASTTVMDADAVSKKLQASGWKKNESGIWSKEIDDSETELAIDIATANLPFLSETAAYLEKTWSALGIKVSVRQFEQSDLTQAVIRTRDYEGLLFGTSVGRSLDFYPFWHSSQRNDPGLNIALYADITTDAALTTARTSTSTETLAKAIANFESEMNDDRPAIFLYVPTIVSLEPSALMYDPLRKMSAPHERFANIEQWYIKTDSVWPIFNSHY